MRSRRGALAPLEPRKRGPELVRDFHVATSAEQLVADVRAHFPEFEALLAREHPECPLDVFAKERPEALFFVFYRLTEAEHRRRMAFVKSLLRAGPNPDDIDTLERFAIQEEGIDQRGQTQTTRGAGAAQADRMA